MIRKYFSTMGKPKKDKKDKIAWRSHEVTRIEAFSDAVFGFAVSLLVISLEVPKNSGELLASLWGMIPFSFCFLIIFWVWRAQYKFFRRYGLHDSVTIALNGILLFFMLGFMYPVKFMFSSIFLSKIYFVRPQDFAPLVMFYNSGFAIISFLFCFMHFNALKKRAELNLTPVEVFETGTIMGYYAGPGFISLLAVFIAFMERNTPEKVSNSFIAYALISVFMPIFGARRDKLFKKKFGNIPVAEPVHNPEE